MTLESDGLNSQTGPESPWRFGRYLRWLAIVPPMLYLLPLVLIRIPGYESHFGSPFAPALEYAFDAAGQNADIVIFGDSAAMINIDPVQMSSALGLKVINLPNTAGSLSVTGDIMLQNYSRHNKPPHLIVGYFTLHSLDYLHRKAIPMVYEGQEMLVDHGAFAQNMDFARSHPSDFLLFPLRFYPTTVVTLVRTLASHKPRSQTVIAGQGHFDPMSTHAAFPSGPCQLPLSGEDFPMDSAREFRQKYTTPQTAVLVYVSPIAACTNAGLVTSQPFAAIPAATPRLLPPSSFKSDALFPAHLMPAAVPGATAQLIEAIQKALPATAK